MTNRKDEGGTVKNPIGEVRFKKREIDDILRTTVLGEGRAKVAHDRQGYYVEEMEGVSDPVGAVIRRLLARLREGRAVGQVKVAPPRTTSRPGRLSASPSGVCAAVRQWAAENPQATLQDAMRHFQDANPTTVRIQFRRGQRT